METFSFVPDYSAKKTRKPEVKKITFGDGYGQRTSVGANAPREEYSLTFTNSFDVIDSISTFLDARDGREEFFWTKPNGATDIFYCDEWDVNDDDYNNSKLTATFKQR